MRYPVLRIVLGYTSVNVVNDPYSFHSREKRDNGQYRILLVHRIVSLRYLDRFEGE